MKKVGRLSPENNEEIVQSFGKAIDPSNKKGSGQPLTIGEQELLDDHNKRMEEIGKTFGVKDWHNMEIDPEGYVWDQLAEECEDCDEELDEDDVEIEE